MGTDMLAKGIKIVGFLFVAFGGFLTGIAPPEEADSKFAVGFSSFLALIILLIVVALAKSNAPERIRRYWIGVAVVMLALSVVAAFVYKSYYDTLVFAYPPGGIQEKYLAGAELTPLAQSLKQEKPNISDAELVFEFGGLANRGLVWTEASVRKARMNLVGSYIALVLSLAAAIFALTEGALLKSQVPGGGAERPASAGLPEGAMVKAPGVSKENLSASGASHTPKAVEIFYSYAHEDEDLREQLDKHLSLLQQRGVIAGWHDRQIGGGEEWNSQINQHLESAHVVLLLISADFLASSYCYSVEMGRALERDKSGEARVIPIILRDCDWQGAPFSHLQAFPKDAKPVTSWSNRDEAFADVAKGIRKCVESLAATIKC